MPTNNSNNDKVGSSGSSSTTSSSPNDIDMLTSLAKSHIDLVKQKTMEDFHTKKFFPNIVTSSSSPTSSSSNNPTSSSSSPFSSTANTYLTHFPSSFDKLFSDYVEFTQQTITKKIENVFKNNLVVLFTGVTIGAAVTTGVLIGLVCTANFIASSSSSSSSSQDGTTTTAITKSSFLKCRIDTLSKWIYKSLISCNRVLWKWRKVVVLGNDDDSNHGLSMKNSGDSVDSTTDCNNHDTNRIDHVKKVIINTPSTSSPSIMASSPTITTTPKHSFVIIQGRPNLNGAIMPPHDKNDSNTRNEDTIINMLSIELQQYKECLNNITIQLEKQNLSWNQVGMIHAHLALHHYMEHYTPSFFSSSSQVEKNVVGASDDDDDDIYEKRIQMFHNVLVSEEYRSLVCLEIVIVNIDFVHRLEKKLDYVRVDVLVYT